MTTNIEFGEWLQKMLEIKSMRPIQLAQASGIDKTIISRALSGERMPKPETLTAIALGLGINPILIFVAAGYLPPQTEETIEKEEFDYLYENLTPAQRKEMISWMKYKLEEEKQSKQNKSSRVEKPPARNVLKDHRT